MFLGLEGLFKFNVWIEEKQPGGQASVVISREEPSGQTWKREKVEHLPWFQSPDLLP